MGGTKVVDTYKTKKALRRIHKSNVYIWVFSLKRWKKYYRSFYLQNSRCFGEVNYRSDTGEREGVL